MNKMAKGLTVSFLTLLTYLLVFSLPSWAQEATPKSSAKASDETAVTTSSESPAPSNSTSSEQQDQEGEVTNAKLRAEMGSKSRFSLSADLSYAGSSLRKPFDDNQPNPDNDPTQSPTRIAGDVSVRYRIDSASSITAGTGIGIVRPFTTPLKKYTVEVSDPFLAYNYARKVGGITRVNKLQSSVMTSEYYTGQNIFASLDASDVSLIGGIGGTDLSVGLALSAGMYFYDGFEESRGPKGATSYQVGFAPFAEYQLNDTFMLRSVVGFYYRNLVTENLFTLVPNRVYQTLGLGIAFTPEIYLYTYVRHHPGDVSKGYVYWSKSASLSSYLTFSVF